MHVIRITIACLWRIAKIMLQSVSDKDLDNAAAIGMTQSL